MRNSRKQLEGIAPTDVLDSLAVLRRKIVYTVFDCVQERRIPYDTPKYRRL